MKTALYFEKAVHGSVRCLLCPHLCTIREGQLGTCGVRRNQDGVLYSETYGKISSIHYDPIEKKPLYHFYPGSIILSIGSVGCNLKCSFCQNASISQITAGEFSWHKSWMPADVMEMASEAKENIGISFTYNEPLINFEYVLEIAELAKSRNLKTVMVSNGFINPEPLNQLMPFMDAFNIDLKAFRNDFYKIHSKARLVPVLDTLKMLSRHNKHFEITNLVIPTLNDDVSVFKQMVKWIHDELGPDSILHLSRYFPHYKMSLPPTPPHTLSLLYSVAKEKLPYVYMGNIASPDGQHTFCPSCSNLLIQRSGYRTVVAGISKNKTCNKCGNKIQNLIL
jgi:pyruvate formate lyase activating enzyme